MQSKAFTHNKLGNDKVIIFSHGFGVRWNARGLFTQISSALKGWDSIFFDYCDTDENNNTYVYGLEKQQEGYINALKAIENKKYKRVIVISHSFGIVIPSIINSTAITEFIAIAPPPVISKQKQLEMLQAKPGGKIDLKAFSQRPRSDGSITYVHYSFYDSLDSLNIPKSFSDCHAQKKTVIIANEDEIVGKDYSGFEKYKGIKLLRLSGNHNFEGADRDALIDSIQQELQS